MNENKGGFLDFLGTALGGAAQIISANNAHKTGGQNAVDVNRQIEDAIRRQQNQGAFGTLSGAQTGILAAAAGLIILLVVLIARR